MKARPILFTGPMVRAILDGEKTQTRRVVKPQPGPSAAPSFKQIYLGPDFANDPAPYLVWQDDPQSYFKVRCPYGVPGDVLYVRETWRPWSWHDGEPVTVEFAADGSRYEVAPDLDPHEWHAFEDWEERINLSMTNECMDAGLTPDENGVYTWGDGDSPLRWRPSIHMPKWASRIKLRVTDVRVERVQEISEEDALAEGITRVAFRPDDGFPICDGYMVGRDDGETTLDPDPRSTFRDLWDSINAKRGYGWESNPWVWVVEFERVTP